MKRALRYLISASLAFGMTLGLFLLMHSLIALAAHEEVKDVKSQKIIEFVRLKRAVEQPIEEQTLPEKAKAETPPPPPDIATPSMNNQGGGTNVASIAQSMEAPTQATSMKDVKLVGGPGLGSAAPSDTEAVPMVRVQPMYPPEAAQRRIEGWVVVEFTITENGSVKNPRVVDAHPSSIFNHAALRSIRKWKYKPKIENGKRVEWPGVRTKLTFKLDE